MFTAVFWAAFWAEKVQMLVLPAADYNLARHETTFLHLS